MSFSCQIANYFHHLLFLLDSAVSRVEMYVSWCRILPTLNEIDAHCCHISLENCNSDTFRSFLVSGNLDSLRSNLPCHH